MKYYLLTVKGNTRSFRVPIIHEEGYLDDWLKRGFDVWPLKGQPVTYTHELLYRGYGFCFCESIEFVEELRNDGIVVDKTNEPVPWDGAEKVMQVIEELMSD